MKQEAWSLGEPYVCGYYMGYPAIEEVRHYMRDLDFEERLSVISQGFHRGISIVRCYSMEEFAAAVGKREDSDPTGGVRTLDWGELLPWLRDTIGDAALADVVEAIVKNGGLEAEIIDTFRVMLFVRMNQYHEVLADYKTSVDG